MHFHAVNTKIRSTYAKYIKEQPQLEALERNTVAEVVSFVENWWGLDFGPTFDLYKINRMLEERVYSILVSLSYYLQGETKAFYKAILARYEIRDIKRVMRALVHHEDLAPLRQGLLALPPSFLGSEGGELTIRSFLSNLEKTEYGRKLIVYEDQPMDRILFYIEMTLDRSYYENIFNHMKKLDKKDQKIARELIGTHIDLINLMYIYRGKRSYEILPQEMANFIIDGGYSLHLPKLRKLVRCETLEEYVKEVQKTHYGYLFPSSREVGLIDIEVEHILYEMYRKRIQSTAFDIAKIIALPILLEYTVRDISTIIESKRVGFLGSRTRGLLSIPEEVGDI